MAVPKPIKKLFIISISLVLAVLLLLVTNVIFAHLYVAKLILFPPEPKVIPSPPPEPKKPPKKKKEKEKREKPPPRVVTKTVYVAPTKEDLERIERELEESEPLPPIETEDDALRSARDVASSVDAQLKRRDEEFAAARREVEELAEAHASFEERLEQDAAAGDTERSAMVATHFAKQSTFLRSVLARTSLKDLGREETTKMLTVAMEDLRWLLTAKGSDEFFFNVDDALLTALVGETTSEANGTKSACHPLYLALDEGETSSEFAPPPRPVGKKPKAKVAKPPAPPISNETARESDLLALVENVKGVLSRRDLSSFKLDGRDPLPHPIDDEAVEEIRSQIVSPVVTTVRNKWNSVLTQEASMRDYWVERSRALQEKHAAMGGGNDGPGPLCASTDLVELMVDGGLEALRRSDDLRANLVNAVFRHAAGDPERILALTEAMKDVAVEEVAADEASSLRTPTPGGSSSWTVGRRSVAYAVDGPLLRRGVANWVDSFVDAIAGYNDHVDALMDWIVGEEGESVGTSLADGLSKMARRVPFPEDHAGRMKKAGILAGRMRVLLEE